MESSQVTCPDCGIALEIEEEYRGEEANCPQCGILFRIPLEGNLGVKLAEADSDFQPAGPSPSKGMIEIACPKCGTTFEVPEDYRGEQAECSECDAVFLIPETGNRGTSIADETVGGPVLPQGPASAQVPPSGTMTESGIQSGADGAENYKKSGTVRLSRSAIFENIMRPQLHQDVKPSARSAPTGAMMGGGRASARGSAVGAHGMGIPSPTVRPASPAPPEPAKPETTTPSTPQPEKQRRAGRKIDLPVWAPRLALGKNEEILACQVAEQGIGPIHFVLTLAPVLLIPIAALLSKQTGSAMPGLVFMVFGAIPWAIYVFKFMPALGKKALITTTDRAIMVDETTHVEIDLDE